MAASMPSVESVQVMVRCRPINSTELGDKRKAILDVDEDQRQVQVSNPKADSGDAGKCFTFDAVFGPSSQQDQVFETVAMPIIDSAMSGYNGTIFAYGQTGTGKTHTMEGQATPDLQGIIPRSFRHIFSSIKEASSTKYMVRVSFLEIYNEQIRDLLAIAQDSLSDSQRRTQAPKHLDLREAADKSVFVDGLRQEPVDSVEGMAHLLQVRKRSVACIMQSRHLHMCCPSTARHHDAQQQSVLPLHNGCGFTCC